MCGLGLRLVGSVFHLLNRFLFFSLQTDASNHICVEWLLYAVINRLHVTTIHNKPTDQRVVQCYYWVWYFNAKLQRTWTLTIPLCGDTAPTTAFINMIWSIVHFPVAKMSVMAIMIIMASSSSPWPTATLVSRQHIPGSVYRLSKSLCGVIITLLASLLLTFIIRAQFAFLSLFIRTKMLTFSGIKFVQTG